MAKWINTSYFDEEHLTDYPVDPKVQAAVDKLGFTNDKMVSFKDVVGGTVAFEAWAYDHHVPGSHVGQRVADRYLQYYTHLKIANDATKTASNAESAPNSVASSSANSVANSNSSSVKPKLTAARSLNPKLETMLMQSDFLNAQNLVSYQELAKRPQAFEKWAHGQGVPLNLDQHLVQDRYWQLYQQIVKEYQAKQQAQVQQQSLAQAMAESKAAISAAASASASASHAQSVAASRSAVQASRAQRSLERSKAHSVKAQMLAQRQQAPVKSTPPTMPGTPASQASGNPFKDYGGLVKPKRHLTSDHDRLVSGFSKELPANDPVFEALQEDPGGVDSILFPEDQPSAALKAAPKSAVPKPTRSSNSTAPPVPHDKPFVNSSSNSASPASSGDDNVDLFGNLFDGDADDGGENASSTSLNAASTDDQSVNSQRIDPVSQAAFQSALANYQAVSSASATDEQPMDVTGRTNARNQYYSDQSLFMEIPKEIDRQYGPYRVSRKLDADEHSRLFVDSHVLNGIRETFDRFLGDNIATELLHATHNERNGGVYSVPDVELQMTYLMYMQTAAGVYSVLTWQQWCAGKVLDRLIVKRRNGQYGYKARSSEMLKQYHTVKAAIYEPTIDPNNHNQKLFLPDLIRWYLYLSTKKPNILGPENQNAANDSVKQQLTQMTNSIDLLQSLCTSLLSMQDESQWRELLLGEQGKKMSYLIKQLSPDLIKPHQTSRRTEITRYRNKVADPNTKRNQH